MHDGVRIAAAVLMEEVTQKAQTLALRLRSDASLPPAAIAAAMVEAGRVLNRLTHHEVKLQPQRSHNEGTA
jgi:hypothetical protein